MKSKFLLIPFVTGVLHLSAQQAVITLEDPLPGNETHIVVARDEVRMINGFSYSPNARHHFHAYTNEDLVLPVIYAANPIVVDDRELNTDLPVGTTAGSHSVSLTGAATYQVPILIPPGTAGMEPSVSVVYNSQSGNGLLGYGWNLAGLSSITRIGHTIYHDEKVKGVNFVDDRFAMDGNRLVVINGEYGGANSEYYTENFNASKIKAHGSAIGGGPLYFTVQTKDGKTIEYGNTDNSRVETISSMASCVISWNINKITDRKGNYIEFVYHKSDDHTQYWIKEIRYTGNNFVNPALAPYNSIHFYYSERTDKHTTYIAGSKLQSNVLLDHIKVFAGSSLVRNYTFNYHYDFYSRLIEIYEFNGLGQRYNSTVFEWGENDHTVSEEQLAYNYVNTDNYFLDYNGDGLSDMIEIYWHIDGNNNKVYDDWKYRSRNHTGFSIQKSFINLIDPKFENIVIGDFNGDGLDDIIVIARSAFFDHVVQAKLLLFSNGNAFNEIPILSPSAYSFNNPFFLPGDYNGDGKDELLVTFKYFNGLHKPSYIYGFSEDSPFSEGLCTFVLDIGSTNVSNAQILPVDFTADGKTDILVTGENTSGLLHFSTLYQVDIENQSVSTVFEDMGFPTNYHFILPGEFNGDGHTDILTWVEGTGWEIHLFDGSNSWIKMTNIPALYNVDPQNANNQYWYAFNVSDYNGDGLSDIIQFNKLATGDLADYNLFLNNGNGFLQHDGQLTNIGGLNLYGGSYGRKTNHLNLDFNGDGKSDLYSSHGYWNDYIYFFEPDHESTRIAKIANGFNQWLYFEFLPLTNYLVYTKYNNAFASSNGVLRDFLFPMYVVKQIKSQNGIGGESTISYFYEGARVHRLGKGFLGFQKRKVSVLPATSVADGFYIQEVSNFDNPEPYFNLVSVSTENILRYHESLGQDFTVSQSSSVNQTRTYPVSDLVFMPYVEQTTAINKLKNNLTITKTSTVDDYGNILTETINYNGEGTTIIETVYTDNGSWCDYLPDYDTVTKTRNGETPYKNETDYIYRADGLIETIRSFMHLANPADETFGYDAFGNITSKTISASGEIPRTESYGYDDKHRFVTEKTNILGYSSFYAYDHRTGNLLNSTNIQGLQTIFSYDGFGRKKGIKYPDGNSTNISRVWNIAGGNLFYTQQQTSGAPMQRTYYDRLGREVLSAYEAYNSNTVYAKTLYDANGRVDKVSEPYYANNSPTQWTIYHYDETGRLDQVDFPTHSETTNYDGMTTTVTNLATGISKSATTDAFGLTVAVTDPTGTINYDYYSHGKPRAIKAPDGCVFSITYDDYLRQETLDDPDAGMVNYEEYTGFGELKRQVHAGRTTETQYDVFGRPDIITYSFDGQSESIQYEYVEEGNGLGQLESISQSNGIGYHYTYDQYGRMMNENEIIEGQTYQSGYTYDSYGNLYKLTYPSGFSVKNEYDRGYLTKQRRGDNNAVLYELPAYNVRGQLTGFKYGNGLSTLLDYDDYGFPDMFLVQSGGTLNLNYNFDPGTGNLNWRNDHTYRLNLHESFSYDEYSLHNRLTGWGEDNQTQISVIYQNNGNIRCKTDISSYTPNAIEYGTSRPHALSQINNPTQEYKDFVVGQDQSITHYAFDKTQSITQANKRLEFVYGPDQSRKIMKYYEKEGGNFVLKKTKYYILGNTEKEVDNVTGETRTLNYIAGKAILEQTSTGNHLYYLHKDYQGTTLAVTDASGNVTQRYAYDPWGRRRNPTTWANLTAAEIEQQNFLFARGYTGHEHLDAFGLINMNGRMYDPLLGRMLSPDNYVQAPDNSQNFNRYSYAMKNPLVYVDPDGEFIIPVIMLAAYLNASMQLISGNVNSMGDFALSIGIGAVSGAAGAGLGYLATSITSVSGFTGGAIAGGMGGFGGGFVSGAGNAWAQGSSFFDGYLSGLKSGAIGALSGAAIGGAISGFSAKAKGYGFWDGVIVDEIAVQGTASQEIVTNYNSSSEAAINDEILKVRMESEFGVKEGDFNIERITTKTSRGYGMNSSGKYVNMKSEDIVGGYVTRYSTGYSRLHVSPHYTMADGVAFRSVAGHELRHAYHHFTIPNFSKVFSERVAYKYTYDTYMGVGQFTKAIGYYHTAVSSGYWGPYPNQYQIPTPFGW